MNRIEAIEHEARKCALALKNQDNGMVQSIQSWSRNLRGDGRLAFDKEYKKEYKLFFSQKPEYFR